MIPGEVRCGFFQEFVLHTQLPRFTLELPQPFPLADIQSRLVPGVFAPIRGDPIPESSSPIPSSRATAAIGRDPSITNFTASSLNCGEKLLFARGNCFPLQIDQFYLVHLSRKTVAAHLQRTRSRRTHRTNHPAPHRSANHLPNATPQTGGRLRTRQTTARNLGVRPVNSQDDEGLSGGLVRSWWADGLNTMCFTTRSSWACQRSC